MDDYNAWKKCRTNDLWVYDKLIVAKYLNYVCGPAGVNVPIPKNYIVRPITNILGMGKNAEIIYIKDCTDHITPGHFWCEIFEGRHFSVDYINQQQVLCVEGIRNTQDPLYKWKSWKKIDIKIPYPPILNELYDHYPHINCEFIDDNLIEIHLRLNPDFSNNNIDVIYPVWEDESIIPPPGMKFVERRDFKRVGFFIPIEC